MLLISHRGNLKGPNKALENNEDYVKFAISQGFNVEIDVWWHDNSYFLGHDFPQWKLEDNSLLVDHRIWCHAKNLAALKNLSLLKEANYFWHQTDDFTLTSKGYFWTYPGKELTSNSICVTNEKLLSFEDFFCIKSYAICSDYVQILRNFT